VGTKLGWLRPRTTGVVALSDNTTSAGVWSIENLFKTGVTMQYNSPTTPAGSGSLRMYNAISLDADRTCLLFGWGNIYAIIYNSATRVFGTITLVRTAGGSDSKIGIKSSTDRVLVVSFDGTAGEAVVLSISGTAITVNTAATTTLLNSVSQGGPLIAVGSSFVQGFTTGLPASYVVALIISGVSCAFGTAASVVSSDNMSLLYATGSVLRVVVGESALLTVKPYTVSSSTLTAGTAATGTATNTAIRAFMNGNGNIVVNYINSTQRASIFKLTTTTEAISTVNIIASASFTSAVDYAVISASKTVFMSHNGSTTWYANILTDTAGTASMGTTISGLGSGSFTAPSATRVSGNTAQFAMGNSARLYQFTLDCSGTSAVASSIIFVSNNTSNGFAPSVQTSATDGTKGAATLRNGGLYHRISGGEVFDWFVSAGSLIRAPRLGNFKDPSFPSPEDNIGYSLDSVNGSAVGVIIQKVEAAA